MFFSDDDDGAAELGPAVELQWAIVALWLVGLLAVKHQFEAGRCPSD